MNHAKAPGSVASHGHTSKGRICKARAVMKRQGGRRDSDGLPASFTSASEREHQLETTVNDLRRQLRDERIRFIVDLRLAGGLMSRDQRDAAELAVRRLSDESLELVRGNLLEMLEKLADFNTTALLVPPVIIGSRHYIA